MCRVTRAAALSIYEASSTGPTSMTTYRTGFSLSRFANLTIDCKLAKMGRSTSRTMDPSSHLSEAVYDPKQFTGSFSLDAPGGYIDGSAKIEATLSRPFLLRSWVKKKLSVKPCCPWTNELYRQIWELRKRCQDCNTVRAAWTRHDLTSYTT